MGERGNVLSLQQLLTQTDSSSSSSNWILMSCQPQRVTSGQSNSSRSKYTFLNSSHIHINLLSSQSTKTDHFTNMKHTCTNIRHEFRRQRCTCLLLMEICSNESVSRLPERKQKRVILLLEYNNNTEWVKYVCFLNVGYVLLFCAL